MTLESALNCGGDTDTVGAMAGALAGMETGNKGIPLEWRKPIWGPPRTIDFLTRLAQRLCEQKTSSQSMGPLKYFWPTVIFRNVVFLVTVLAHGIRRLFPPY